jgi:hypothetical protein
VLRVFIVFKNTSPSAGIEPMNLGSNGKNPNNAPLRTISPDKTIVVFTRSYRTGYVTPSVSDPNAKAEYVLLRSHAIWICALVSDPSLLMFFVSCRSYNTLKMSR